MGQRGEEILRYIGKALSHVPEDEDEDEGAEENPDNPNLVDVCRS